METHDELKTGVSVSEMAKMMNLSRSRCYQLIEAGILYPPIFDTQTHRPFFPPEIQQKNLEIRKRNCGMNGKPILFYARKFATEPVAKKLPARKAKSKTQNNPIIDRLMNDLKSLGLDCPNRAQIESTLKSCFPAGINQVDESEVLRTLYRTLKRQNTNDNVER
jgi:hypothetical protein